MGEGRVGHGGRELVLLIRPRLARGDQLDPTGRGVGGRLCPLAAGGGGSGVPRDSVHLDLLRVVPAEVGRVDEEALDEAGGAEADDGPVDVAPDTGAGRLPAVAHVLAAAGEEEVVLGAKVLVAAGDGDAAVLGGGEVEDGGGIGGEDGHGVAEEAEARDAAVGVHVEADVGVALLLLLLLLLLVQPPAEALRGPALAHAEDGLPATAAAAPGQDLVVGAVVRGEAALDGDVGGVVAAEEGGVDLDAGDGARGDAEADDDPVEGFGVVAARLPAVVPGARVDHLAGGADGRGRGQEVGGLGEPLVREAEDAAAQSGGDEVFLVVVVAGVSSLLRVSLGVVQRMTYLYNLTGRLCRCPRRPPLWSAHRRSCIRSHPPWWA